VPISSRAFQLHPGIWSSYLAELSPEEMVRAFADKGWNQLELSSEHAKKLLARGAPRAAGSAFGNYSREHGVVFPQGHLWLECDIVDPDQPHTLDELRRWLDLFDAIGIRSAVLHPGGLALQTRRVEAERIRGLNLCALGDLARHVESSSLLLCLENMRYFPANTVLSLADAMQSPHVAICLDTGHLNVRKEDPARFIRAAGARLKALHIADNDGNSDQHLAPYGAGTVPWDSVMRALNECGYSGLFNLEVPGERRCPLDVRLMKLDYFKGVLAFMERLAHP